MIPFEVWLRSFGFVRNPFETTEAGGEAEYNIDFLHATFVKPEGFDRILGHPSHPKSSLVFASRGRGKSTARLMLAHFCQQGIFSSEDTKGGYEASRVLPVTYTHFDRLHASASSSPALVDAHVTEILFRAVPAMVKMMTIYPDLAERIRNMHTLRRLELQSFLVFYRTYVPFQDYGAARDILGNELVQENLQGPIGFAHSDISRSQIGLTAKEIELLLTSREKASPADLLGRFASLLTDAGLQAVYILIDGLDEIFESADDPLAAAGMIVPLLSNLGLMNNTPRVSFKVFAPTEIASLLLEATRKVRRDRLDVLDIQLQEPDLTEILQRRLSFCSDNTISSLDAACVPDMRNRIDTEIARRADGNPRCLILLGDYMIRAHCQAADPENEREAYLLTENDLDSATLRLAAEFPPTSLVAVTPEKEVPIERSQSGQTKDNASYEEWPRYEFPAPLAVAYLAYIRERIAHARVWKLYDLVEAVTAYHSLILLSLLYHSEKLNTSQRLERIDLDMKRLFMGRWRYAAEVLPGLCSGLKIKHPLVGGTQRLMHEHFKFLTAINEERNRFAHHGPQPEDVCQKILGTYDTPLKEFLLAARIINRGSRLVKVQEIVKQGPELLHHCTLYQGDTLSFPHLDLTFATALDSEQLWLINNSSIVNLHPLMLAQVAPGNLVEEVWLYQGVENGLVSHKSYGTGRTLSTKQYRPLIKEILGV